MKKVLVGIVLVAFMFVSLIGRQSVRASDNVATPTIPSKPVAKIVPNIVDYGNGFLSWSYGGNVVDKQSTKGAIDLFMDNYLKSRSITANGYRYTLSGSYYQPYGNGSLGSWFNSNLDFDLPRGFTTRITVIQSTSYALWSGTTPQYNATTIQITDSFTFYGLGISVSVGTSGGGGSFSIVGNTVNYVGSVVSNVWYTGQMCSNVTGSGALTSFAEQSTAHFFFQSALIRDVFVISSNSMWV